MTVNMLNLVNKYFLKLLYRKKIILGINFLLFIKFLIISV